MLYSEKLYIERNAEFVEKNNSITTFYIGDCKEDESKVKIDRMASTINFTGNVYFRDKKYTYKNGIEEG